MALAATVGTHRPVQTLSYTQSAAQWGGYIYDHLHDAAFRCNDAARAYIPQIARIEDALSASIEKKKQETKKVVDGVIANVEKQAYYPWHSERTTSTEQMLYEEFGVDLARGKIQLVNTSGAGIQQQVEWKEDVFSMIQHEYEDGTIKFTNWYRANEYECVVFDKATGRTEHTGRKYMVYTQRGFGQVLDSFNPNGFAAMFTASGKEEDRSWGAFAAFMGKLMGEEPEDLELPRNMFFVIQAANLRIFQKRFRTNAWNAFIAANLSMVMGALKITTAGLCTLILGSGLGTMGGGVIAGLALGTNPIALGAAAVFGTIGLIGGLCKYAPEQISGAADVLSGGMDHEAMAISDNSAGAANIEFIKIWDMTPFSIAFWTDAVTGDYLRFLGSGETDMASMEDGDRDERMSEGMTAGLRGSAGLPSHY